MPDANVQVKITVTCECGTVIGIFFNTIDEKYPFYCDECDEYKRAGRYPWSLTTGVVPK